MMNPKKIRIVSFLLIMSCSGLLSIAYENEGWDALLQNQYAKAKSEFSCALQDGKTESTLQGLALCAKAEANPVELSEYIKQLIVNYPESPYLPCYLALWGDPNLQGWNPKDKIALLDKALQKNPAPPYRQQTAYKMAQTMDMVFDDHIEDMSRKAGIVLDHWNVVGPFGRFGNAGFLRPFGPETAIRPDYQGWQKQVEIHPLKFTDKTGLVEFKSLVYPVTGVMYALNVIESQQEGEAYLTIHSPSDIRVWWDGEPVLEKSQHFLDTSRSVSVKVPLRKGKILLVIKSKRDSSWWIRTSLQTTNNTPLKVKSVPLNVNDFSGLFLIPFEARKKQNSRLRGIRSEYPFTLQETNDRGQLVQSIFKALWHAERNEYVYAKELLQDAAKQAENFALIWQMIGDLSLRHGNARSGSKTRFQREAENAFNRALELAPYSKSAVIGLQSYYLDRDQTDQALKIMDEHVQLYPDILEQGYTGLLHYSYGVLYTRKQFWNEAIHSFEQSLDEFIPSLEVYTKLFDYYHRNNNFKKASKIAEDALDFFPAYLPYLNRATRLGPECQSIPGITKFYKQALNIHPYGLKFCLGLGTTLERFGEYEKAFEWYEKQSERFTDHPLLQERKAALSFLTSGQKEAFSAYEEVHQSIPTRMEPFRALRDVAGRDDFPYMKYDVHLDDIDPSKAEKWEESRASGIYLLDIMVLNLYPDGTYEQYIHQAIKILNQEGMRKWAEIVIPKSPKVEIIMARTITPDGTEWAVSNVQNLNNQQSLSMYGIEEGAIVEYAYLERTGSRNPGTNVSSGGYYFGSEDDPMLLSKLTVIKPKDLVMHLDTNPDTLQASITHTDDKTIYEWEQWMSEGIKPEQHSPPISERVPSLQWSTCPDWLPFVEGLRMTIPGYEESSDVILNLVEQLKEDCKSKQEYVQKVYDWIRLNIEESQGGKTSADTIVLQAGNSYQKLRLARHLLRLEGIETHLAHALENDEHDGFRPLPYPAYSGTTVLIVPVQEKIDERLVLNFSSRFMPLDEIPGQIKKQVALIYDKTVPYFEPVEPELWEHGLVYREMELSLQADHSAGIKGFYVFDDGYDWQIRDAFTNPELKERITDAQIVNDLSGIQLENSTIEDIEDISKPPKIVFEGIMPDIAKPTGQNTLKLSTILIKSKASELVNEATREFPVLFKDSAAREPLQISFDVSHYLDQGASIELPSNTFLLNEFGYYSLFYNWDGSNIVARRSLLIPPQKISPEKYGDFVSFCRKIDQMEDQEITIYLNKIQDN